MPNLNFIKEHGIKKFIEQQKKRIKLLLTMIENFDDGRSRIFFCKAVALLELASLENSLDVIVQRVKTDNIKPNNSKTKAKFLKSILNEITFKEGVELIKKR